MLTSILGFGRIWTTRAAREGRGAAYFNTTGVMAKGKCHHRSCIYGYVRIDECTGFHPQDAGHVRFRVYRAAPLSTWDGKRKLFLEKLAEKHATPECYLVGFSATDIGWIDRSTPWICDTGEVLSFSEGDGQQEALVLMPPFGWVRGAHGSFCLAINSQQPRIAKLTEMEEQP
jgi:hypothetical protein